MDAIKAQEAARLCFLRADLDKKVKDFKATMTAAFDGANEAQLRFQRDHATTTIQIPVRWLPVLISVASSEIDNIDKEINDL